MNSKLISMEGSSGNTFSSESLQRPAPKDNVRSFVIALLLLTVLLITFIATMLVHSPQKVDAFLNSDQPAENKQVVTSSK